MDTLLVSDSQPTDFEGSQFDGSPNPGSPFDSFEFAPEFSHPEASFPHTPSYNGSYQNSPYSILSDLPSFDDDHTIGLFDPSSTLNLDDYDPSSYDAPSSSGLFTLDDNFMSGDGFPQVSITPPAFDQKMTSIMVDHGSPASSNGGEDDARSHASSTSSYQPPASPHLNFESLRFDSPAFSPAKLPSSPPSHKASPPQLVIPPSPSPEPPTINAPSGDGVMSSGPQLHIVPATPVSGGGDTAQPVLFQTAPASDGSSSLQQSDSVGWSQAQNLSTPTQNQGTSGMTFGGETPHESMRTEQFLLPQAPQRTRSLSDTSLRPPAWDAASLMGDLHQGTNSGADGSHLTSHDGRRPTSAGTVNMNDVLPEASSSNLLQTASFRPSPFRYPNSAGPNQTTFGPTLQQPSVSQPFNFGHPGLSTSLNPNYLTPDIAAVNLRRTKSDNRGHRQVRSEDIRFSTPSSPFNISGMLVPPPSSASQEFIRATSTRQYLHPTEPVASITRHIRRASSGSRERPGMGGLTGWSSGGSSARASPYPSPSASPRPGYGALPDMSMPMNMNASPMRRVVSGGMLQVDMGMGADMDMGMGMNMGMMNTTDTGIPTHITKVNVTTPSTADASQKRRKQPANFMCPIPGCGSTFTRHFNLKGHLRSHAEEKPFQCKWPGCGKGFARQHDCKRHEQLHLNIRPYPCEGCKKNFARMDALNRHLRSEGGAECRKLQEELTPASVQQDMSRASTAGPSMKPDPDGDWSNGGYVL